MALFPASSMGGVHSYHTDITDKATVQWAGDLYYTTVNVNTDINGTGKTVIASFEATTSKKCWVYIDSITSTKVVVGLVRPDSASANVSGRVNVVIYD